MNTQLTQLMVQHFFFMVAEKARMFLALEKCSILRKKLHIGNDVIVVDDKQYTYEIDSENESITFSPSFLGIAKKFDCKLE